MIHRHTGYLLPTPSPLLPLCLYEYADNDHSIWHALNNDLINLIAYFGLYSGLEGIASIRRIVFGDYWYCWPCGVRTITNELNEGSIFEHWSNISGVLWGKSHWKMELSCREEYALQALGPQVPPPRTMLSRLVHTSGKSNRPVRAVHRDAYRSSFHCNLPHPCFHFRFCIHN